jgi:DNA polymerase-3 subunit gamma/tau
MATAAPPHLVLARKWRPERFSDLVGQEQVTRTLSQALLSGRIAHAFLFTGIRGVGKTTAARILARCLNCERGPTPEPCGECAACIEIRQGRALDVVEIDGATYRKIDDARSIIENLSYRPARDRFKIYIIDEAHQLTDQAFNALLKTLEEPPPHVKFILATTEPQKMPETILSRLQRYDFRRLPFRIILERLRELARREAVAVDEGAIALLAREAGGSMRDAERMLETALSLAGDGPVTESAVADSLGVASRARVFALTEAVLAQDASAALGVVHELHTRGANLAALGRDLLETLRNLVVAKLPQGGALTVFGELPDHEAEALKRLAERPSQRDLMRLFRLMAQAQEEILRSPYADMLLEMAVVRMATLAPVMDGEELTRTLRTLSGKGTSGGGSSSGGTGKPAAASDDSAPRRRGNLEAERSQSKIAEAAPSAAPAAGERAQAAGSNGFAPAPARRLRVEGEVKASAPPRSPAAAERPQAETVAPDLPELREHIRARRAPLAGFMEHGAALELRDDTLKLTARDSFYVRYFNENKSTIAELATEFYGRPIQVEMAGAVAAAPAPSPPPAEPAPKPPRASSRPPMPPPVTMPPPQPTEPALDREAARKELFADPVVRQILEELEGRLVDIRRNLRQSESE